MDMFSAPPPTPTPTPKPPAVMPDVMSPEVMAARNKARMDVMQRAGRSSTILTAPKDRPGGDYSATSLGAGASTSA